MHPATQPTAAEPARKSADAIVVVAHGDVEWRGSFAHFVADNKDGLTLHDIETICAVLEVGGTYHGGGGADAPYTIKLGKRS